MEKIEYKGKVYEGENRKQLIEKLREARLSQQTIGDLFDLSRERISQILGRDGRIDYPELDDPKTFVRSDESIAISLDVPVSRVSAARRSLNIKAHYKVNTKRRKRRLVQTLFGNGYLPGPAFDDYLLTMLADMPDKKKNAIIEFYLGGDEQSSTVNLNSDSQRVYRSLARKALKEKTDYYSISGLLQGKVIKHGKRNTKG